MKCGHCGTTGSFVTVEHVWACSQHGDGPHRPEPVPVTEEGIYFDGHDYFKVVIGVTSGKPYAKVWVSEPDSYTVKGWNYAPGAVKRLNAGMRVTAEQAARFGRLTGACVFCSRKLTDERSIEVGYGPVCAEREGLPWGEVAKELVPAESPHTEAPEWTI